MLPGMAKKKPRRKRPRDSSALAASIVAEATNQGTLEASKREERKKDPAAVSLGRRGGLKGGKARAEKLPPERRVEIALKAARARWKGEKERKRREIIPPESVDS